jgi:hypothetical protein
METKLKPRTCTVRVHRVTVTRWTEEHPNLDGSVFVREHSFELHDVGDEQRPIRPTQRATKLQRAQARYSGQSLRGADQGPFELSDGAVHLKRGATRIQRSIPDAHLVRPRVEVFAGRGVGL